MESDIRKASVADHEVLVSLAEACEGAPQWSAAVWKQVLQSAEEANALRVVLLAATAHGPVGFGVISILPDAAEIESLGVLASARRRGLGTMLCRALLRTAAEGGVREVQLEVRSRNAAALTLYQRLGFAETARRRGYYRDPDDDAVLMSISLSEQEQNKGTLLGSRTL